VTTARVAGLLYLLTGLAAVFGLQYVPRTLIVTGDAAATADHVRSAELLFRLGIASELISATGFIFLALALYSLFESVDRGQASLMVVLVLVSVPISFLAVVSELGALTVLSGADFLSVLGGPQREALALVFVRTHGQTLLVNEIFWGLWLVPLGVLVMRSGFAPRVIGALLILAGAAYIVITSVSILLPDFATVVSTIAALPQAAGEVSMIVWLLTTRAGANAPASSATIRARA